MKTTLGTTIRKARELHCMTRVDLAKELNISTYYVSHLENDDPVYFSENLLGRMKKVLGITEGRLRRLARAQNESASKYYSQYRKRKSA